MKERYKCPDCGQVGVYEHFFGYVRNFIVDDEGGSEYFDHSDAEWVEYECPNCEVKGTLDYFDRDSKGYAKRDD